MSLHLTILLILRNAEGCLLPQSTLVNELRLRDCKESLAEIYGALRDLEGREQVIGVHNQDTGNKWKITDEGVVRLAEANL